MALYRNTFEGGTDGTSVTTANSGGLSGDALSFTAASGTWTRAFTATSATHGTMGCRLVADTASTSQVGFNITASDSAKLAVQFRLRTLPSTNDSHLAIFRGAAANDIIIRLDATNKIKVTTSGGTQLAIATAALVANTHYRLECVGFKGTTTSNGRFLIAYYLGNSTTPEWSFDSTAAVNTGTEQFTSIRVGKQSGANALDMDVDELRVMEGDGTTTFLGPVANVAPSVTVVGNQSVAAAATVNLTSTATDSDGSIASRAWSFDYSPTTAPTLTGGTTANASFTAGAAPALYVLRHTATDDGGATGFATTEVRVNGTGSVSTINANGSVVGTFANTGGASTRGAALSDASDTTYLESTTVTSTEQSVRIRLQPASVRSSGTITVRLAQDTAGTFTTKIRLFEGSTLRQEWTVPTTTTIANQAVTLSGGTIAAIGDWGNLYLEVAAVV